MGLIRRMLGLIEIQHSRIGDESQRGISGGQRKSIRSNPTPVSTNQKPPFRFRFALERSQPHVH